MFGADGLLSRLDPSSPVNSGRTFYSFDIRGAVTQRLYAGGNPYQTDLYFANGYRSERLLDYSDPWGFGAQAGYVTDLETGLMLCTHRFYDPNVGRFLTRDPMGYAGGINLYGYTKNNPVNWADPLGYMMAAGAILAGAGGFAATTEEAGLAADATGVGAPVGAGLAVLGAVIFVGGAIIAGGVYLASRSGQGSNLPGPSKGGPPNGSLNEDDGAGNGTIRDYGPDGKPVKDIDFGHDHDNVGDPHCHDWVPKQGGGLGRGPHRPIAPGEK